MHRGKDHQILFVGGPNMQNGTPEWNNRQKFEFSQIQDGGGRHFEKPWNRDIFRIVWPIFTKFGRVTRMGTPDPSELSNLHFSESKMADGRHFEKSKNRHISATVSYTHLRAHETPERIDCYKLEFLIIQHGGGRHFQKTLNCDISANILPIWTKFGMVTRMGTQGPSEL